MASQEDQDGFTGSRISSAIGNGISLSSGPQSVAHIQPKDHFSCGNDHALKVRKPYTITKQRERWTDDEHKKFLEALKLYGRAWRRIEEHVGTKTAVQIRSHAQKFFSKVLRDSSGNIKKIEESIEIPPPRPKRKPMHPYPRKHAEALNKEILIPEKPMKSNSLKSTDFDQENQSPKSVLSRVGSESLGSSDSDMPNGSLSPMSSISGVHDASVFTLSEFKTPLEEARLDANSAHDEKPLMKPKLHHSESVSAKVDTAEESSARTLKLFGMTLFVTESCKPSSPTIEACKPIPHEICISKENGKLELLGHGTLSEKIGISKLRVRVRPETCGKGFVPYKRCILEKENQSSSSTADVREEQSIHLSL